MNAPKGTLLRVLGIGFLLHVTPLAGLAIALALPPPAAASRNALHP